MPNILPARSITLRTSNFGELKQDGLSRFHHEMLGNAGPEAAKRRQLSLPGSQVIHCEPPRSSVLTVGMVADKPL